MAKEKNLTNVTSIAAADFVRLVTSAGASVKATAANLAKYVIETYNDSSVAGSSQSVKDALDSLNSKYTDVTRTTTVSGAFEIPSELQSKAIIDVYPLNATALVIRRDMGYFMIKNATDLTAVSETSITLRIWHQ